MSDASDRRLLEALLALLGLVECPVIHAGLSASRTGVRAVRASMFEFISENRHIPSVHEFMRSLPDVLGG